jgi:hypothetical protein
MAPSMVSNSSLDELCYYQPPRRALIQRTFPGRFPRPHLSTWWKPVAMSHNSPSAHVQPAASIAGELVSTSPLAGCDRLKWR